MVRLFALIVIMILGIQAVCSGNIVGVPLSGHQRTMMHPEVERALARLPELSVHSIRRQLRDIRPPAYQPGPLLLNEIMRSQGQVNTSRERLQRLEATLQPVLAYHDRDGKIAVMLLVSEQPKAYLVCRAAIIVTTKLLQITTASELRGIVAHELAHEYVWEESMAAQSQDDQSLQREIELFCDVVAAVTLKELGDDPAIYAKALERMVNIGISAGSATRRQTETHPALDLRVKLNRFLSLELSC